MRENKISNWIINSNENRASLMLILSIDNEDMENTMHCLHELNKINKKRFFYIHRTDSMYEEKFDYSQSNQIIVINKNHSIQIKDIEYHIKRGCIYIEDKTSIFKLISLLRNNEEDISDEIKYELIEKIDFETILKDKTNLISVFFNKVEILRKIGIYFLDKKSDFYLIVLDYYVKYNVISANCIHKLYQMANLDFRSTTRAIGDIISIIIGVKSKSINFNKISIKLRGHVNCKNIKVYDLNFNQIEYDTKLNIAKKLIKLDSKDLNHVKISKILELKIDEIEKLYAQVYLK